MMELWTVVLAFVAGLAGWVGGSRLCSSRRARRARLAVGALVFVCTSDKKRLIARILSRGPSHCWIELAPGDARWWVPTSAIEPIPDFLARRIERERVASLGERAQAGVNRIPRAGAAIQRRTHIS